MNQNCTPRLKPLVEYYSTNKKIYFFNKPGIAIEMEDESRFIEYVCKLMDGKKTFLEIEQTLFLEFPKETPFLQELLTVLDNEYLLEDTLTHHHGNLSDYDLERWSRNIEFLGAHCKIDSNKYLLQQKIKSQNIVILGLGGVGSNVLYNLTAMGVSNITAIDCDLVELSNLNRQIIYNETDVGQPKATVAQKRISDFSPKANIKFITQKITSGEDIEQLLSKNDLVIAAIDHPRDKVMDWVNSACISKNSTFICGALDSHAAMCYTVIPQVTGCIECWKSNAKKSRFLFQDLIKKEHFNHSLSPNVAIMPLISITAGIVANEALKIITGIGTPQSLGCVYTFDFLTSQVTTTESWEKNPACQTCTIN